MKYHVLESQVKSALADTVLVLVCTASSIINKDLDRWVLYSAAHIRITKTTFM